MTRVYALALNTFRESIRDRVLYVLLFFAAITIGGSKLLGYISVGEDEKVIVDVSLAAISVFGALIAIMVGTNLVYTEIDKRTIYTILSTPIYRYEFILGKFLGLMALIVLVCLLTSLMAAGYIVIMGGTVSLTFVAAIYLIVLKLAIVTAAAVLLSTLTSPILGALIVFCFYFFGHATGILIDLPVPLSNPPTSTILETIYYICPNLANFDIRSEAANGVPVESSYILWTTIYAVLYTTLFMILAALAFQDKDV